MQNLRSAVGEVGVECKEYRVQFHGQSAPSSSTFPKTPSTKRHPPVVSSSDWSEFQRTPSAPSEKTQPQVPHSSCNEWTYMYDLDGKPIIQDCPQISSAREHDRSKSLPPIRTVRAEDTVNKPQLKTIPQLQRRTD